MKSAFTHWANLETARDVDYKQYRTYDRALGDTTYGFGHLEKGAIDVHLKCSSAEEKFNPAYY